MAEAITGWDGSDPGLGSAWIQDTVAPLPEREQPAARFALVGALASYRVDRGVVDAVRPTHPTDADLVSVAAWASARAALADRHLDLREASSTTTRPIRIGRSDDAKTSTRSPFWRESSRSPARVALPAKSHLDGTPRMSSTLMPYRVGAALRTFWDARSGTPDSRRSAPRVVDLSLRDLSVASGPRTVRATTRRPARPFATSRR